MGGQGAVQGCPSGCEDVCCVGDHTVTVGVGIAGVNAFGQDDYLTAVRAGGGQGEQGGRGCPAFLQVGSPRSRVLSSRPVALSGLLWAQDSLLGRSGKRPRRRQAPLEPSRREGLGVQLGQCREGGPSPQTYSSHSPHAGQADLAPQADPPRSSTRRAEEAGVLPWPTPPPPAPEGAGFTCARAASPPSPRPSTPPRSAGEGGGPLARLDPGM